MLVAIEGMPLAKAGRRRYTQQPFSLRTAHRGKYGSEIYAAASYGSMGIWRKISRLPPRRRRLRANTRGDGVRGGGGASVRSRSPRGGLRLGGLAPSKASLVRLRPRATLLDAGEKAATCLAPLVQTSNASPPAFLEDFWRTRAHPSRVIPLGHPAGRDDRNWC